MLSAFHVVFAAVVVVADVRDLFVDGTPVVSLPLLIVVQVAVVLVGILVVLVLLGDLENHLVLLLLVQVVRVNQLELRVVADVVVLVHLLVFLDHVQGDGFLLDEELRVLVLQEGSQILVLPLGGLFWVEQRLPVHHLQFVVAVVGCEVRVLHQLRIQVEFMSGKWINCQESDDVGLCILHMADILDSLLKHLMLTRGWSQLSGHVAHAPHDNVHINVLKLLSDAVGLSNNELVSEEIMN
jgi:hypothetical protein